MKEKVNESINKKINKNIFEQYKKKGKKLSQSEKRVLALIILLIISAITFFLIIFNLIKGQEVSNEINKYTQAKGVDKEHFERVRNAEEYKRMKIYTGEIIKSIVNKQYESVYNRLDKDYKEKYFNTLEEFKKYCENRLPENLVVIHNNIERIGEYYVLDVDLVNSENPRDIKSRRNVYFVFKEYKIEDYVFSFAKKSYVDEEKREEILNN